MPGTAASRPSTRRSRSARMRAPSASRDASVARARRPSRPRRRRSTCPSAGPAPGRRLRSAARAATPPRTTSAPVPFGPPNLCAEIATRSASRPRRADVEPRAPPAPRRCARRPPAHARAPGRRSSSSGWMVPTSLFTSITETTTVRSSSASASASRSTTPSRPAPRPARPGTPRRSRRSHDASTPLCSKRGRDDAVAAAGRTGGAGGALHREVVGLGAAGGEHHLAGAGPEQPGDLLPGLLERGLGRAGRRVPAATGCRRRRQERRPSRRPPRAAHRAWWRRGPGTTTARRFTLPKSTKRRARRRAGNLAGAAAYRPASDGISVTPPGDTPDVTTQLRLVEAPGRSEPRAASKRATANTKATEGAPRPRQSGRAAAARRPVNWGDWQLDARTRQRRARRRRPRPARHSRRPAAAQQLPQAS